MARESRQNPEQRERLRKLGEAFAERLSRLSDTGKRAPDSDVRGPGIPVEPQPELKPYEGEEIK